jgi:nucleoside-diphosphate-sugar epimerase
MGAGGFIGTHLVNRLKDEGHYVCGVDIKLPEFSQSLADHFVVADLTVYNSFSNLPIIEFDEIYQLAADMGGAEYIFSGINDAAILFSNVQINLNLIKYLQHNSKNARIFYSSSACIYPLHNQMDPSNPICSEDSAYPANPDSEYGWEKLFSERLFLTYAKNSNAKVRIARYHNVYGPLGTWQGGREKAPAAICRKVIQAVDSIELIGTGEQTRSFLYIDDCIEGTIRLLRSDISSPINIGSEEMITINTLADIACSIEGKLLTKVHIEGPQGVPGRTSDNTLANLYLGWNPLYTTQEGLTKTYNWIKEQIEKYQ